MKIYFTRHGQVLPVEFIGSVDFPKGDIPLSEKGKMQAARLGDALAARHFRGPIFCSPYDRTATTADIIAAKCDCQVYPMSALREKIFVEKDALEFRGMTGTQLKARFGHVALDAALEYPWWTTGVDSIADIADRVRPFWNMVIESGYDEVLAVCHGATQVGSTHYFNQRYHLGLPETVEALEEYLIPRFLNCNLSYIELDEEKRLLTAKLLTTDHLPDELLSSNSEKAVRPNPVFTGKGY